MPKDAKKEFFAVAGALDPTCKVANQALLAMYPGGEKKIIIIGIPYGPSIPEEIRKGWTGTIIMKAHGPLTISTMPIFNENSDRAIFVRGYVVDTSVALQSLNIVSKRSWKWFLNKKLPEHLFFNENCCKEQPVLK